MKTRLLTASLIACLAVIAAAKAASTSKPYRCGFDILNARYDGSTAATSSGNDEDGDCTEPLY